MSGKFEVYQDKAGKYRWRLKSRNGQILASGEDYDTQAAAVRGIRAVRRAVEGAAVYAEIQEKNAATARTITKVNSASKLVKLEEA